MAAMNYEDAAIQVPDEAFPDDVEPDQEDEVLAWRELPQNIWLRIMHQKDVKMEERDVVKILKLLQRDGTTYKAWSTAIISNEIDDMQRKREEQEKVKNLPQANLYVKCLGRKHSKSNPTRSYFNFKLMYF